MRRRRNNAAADDLRRLLLLSTTCTSTIQQLGSTCKYVCTRMYVCMYVLYQKAETNAVNCKTSNLTVDALKCTHQTNKQTQSLIELIYCLMALTSPIIICNSSNRYSNTTFINATINNQQKHVSPSTHHKN